MSRKERKKERTLFGRGEKEKKKRWEKKNSITQQTEFQICSLKIS